MCVLMPSTSCAVSIVRTGFKSGHISHAVTLMFIVARQHWCSSLKDEIDVQRWEVKLIFIVERQHRCSSFRDDTDFHCWEMTLMFILEWWLMFIAERWHWFHCWEMTLMFIVERWLMFIVERWNWCLLLRGDTDVYCWELTHVHRLDMPLMFIVERWHWCSSVRGDWCSLRDDTDVRHWKVKYWWPSLTTRGN